MSDTDSSHLTAMHLITIDSLQDEIQQALLFGGSTRIPRVQNELVKVLGGFVSAYGCR